LLSIQWAAKPENAEVQLSDSERIVSKPEVKEHCRRKAIHSPNKRLIATRQEAGQNGA
jgi:hypothetical protein